MRKLLVAGLVGVMLAGGGVALADHSGSPMDDIENHPALYGLCTAWHANEQGRENGNPENAPPFQALQDAADEQTNGNVSEFCEGVRPGNGHGNGGGNAPDPSSHPGDRGGQ